jgi:hypothetical protein
VTETCPKRTLLACCALVSAFSLLVIVTFDYGRDQGIYAVVARTVLDGGMPYRDAWDFKPPGIFVIYALARAVVGSAQIGIRILEIAGLIAMAVGMVHLARRLWNEPLIGVIAATIAILVHAQLDFWHTAQPESFGGMLTIGGLCCALAVRRRLLAWFAAGALFGFAGLLKPPLIAGAAVVAVMLAARAWKAHDDRRAALRAALLPIAMVSAGVVAIVGACVTWFASRGALSDLYDVLFGFTPNYTKLGWNLPLASLVLRGLFDWFLTYNSLLTAGLIALLIERVSPDERFGVRLLLAVIAFHILGVVMQGKFFAYHWGATWPPTALVAALGVWKVWMKAVKAGRLAVVGFFVAAALVASLASASEPASFRERSVERVTLLVDGDQASWDRLASVADVDADANRAVATWLRDHVPADRSIYVWGFEPVIYDLADRACSTRFIYNVPQRVKWNTIAARALLIRDLREHPPAAIVIERRDVFPFVTGDRSDSATALRSFPELTQLVSSYVLVEQIQDFDIYLAR